jgi:hypothetical protein
MGFQYLLKIIKHIAKIKEPTKQDSACDQAIIKAIQLLPFASIVPTALKHAPILTP